jgi:hypothetical protein
MSQAEPLKKEKPMKSDLSGSKEHPYFDGLLQVIFFAECFWLVLVFAPAKSQLLDPLAWSNVALIGLFTLVVSQVVWINTAFYGYVGKWISDLTTGHFRKHRALKNFQNQGWQLTVHLSMTLWELYVLYQEPQWWFNTASIWTPHPEEFTPSMAIRMLYLVQLAIW